MSVVSVPMGQRHDDYKFKAHLGVLCSEMLSQEQITFVSGNSEENLKGVLRRAGLIATAHCLKSMGNNKFKDSRWPLSWSVLI